jgi:hypothetical protein
VRTLERVENSIHATEKRGSIEISGSLEGTIKAGFFEAREAIESESIVSPLVFSALLTNLATK